MPDTSFNVLHPQAFWLLVILPPVIMLVWRSVRSSANWSKVIDAHLLSHLISDDGTGASPRGHWWAALWLSLLILAVAGPSFTKIDVPVFQRADALVIVLDLSASMAAADIQPSRVQRAKQKIMDLLTQREEGVTGLVVYAGDAHVVAPLTDDRRTVENLLTALSPAIMPLPGSNATEALERSLALLQTAGAANGQILLMTDGMPKFEPSRVANQFESGRVKLSILGIGTPIGAPIPRSDGGFLRDDNGNIVIPGLDSDELKGYASALGGRYAEISLDSRDISALTSDDGVLDPGEIAMDRETDTWLDQGNWLALFLALTLLPLFRRGALAALLLIPLLIPHPAEAQTFSNLWQTRDQQGAAALESGDPEKAALLFEDSDWRGAAHYAAEQWDKAADEFSKTKSADNWYNQGNALALAGDLNGALQAYDASLAIEPEAGDTLRNRDIVEQLLQQQDPQSQQGEDGEQGDSGENESDNSQQGNSEEDDANSQNQQGDGSESDSSQQSEGSSGDQNEQQAGDSESNSSSQAETEQSGDQQSDNGNDALSEEMQARLDEQTREQMGKFDAGLEKQQALEQWLRRVPDDPGGLLQRKFRYETIQRLRQGEEPDEDVSW